MTDKYSIPGRGTVSKSTYQRWKKQNLGFDSLLREDSQEPVDRPINTIREIESMIERDQVNEIAPVFNQSLASIESTQSSPVNLIQQISLIQMLSLKEEEKEIVLEILSIYSRNNLTQACLQDLLSLANLVAKNRDIKLQIPRSVYLFKKSFKIDFVKSFSFQTKCCGEIVFDYHSKNKINCPKCNSKITKRQISLSTETSFRYKLSNQLGYLFNSFDLKPVIYENSRIASFVDGKVYRQLAERKPGKRLIALTLFADGAQVLKKHTLYTFQVKVNDLDANGRQKTILNGCAYTSKPNLEQFLREFIIEINSFSTDGLYVDRYQQTVYPFVMAFLLDGKARPDFLCHSSFNTLGGCQRCYVNGETVQSGKGHSHIFPAKEERKLRTKEEHETIFSLLQTGAEEAPCLGVKSRSILYDIREFDPVIQVPSEAMHQFGCGILLRMFESMQKFSKKDKPCFINSRLRRVINSRLSKINLNSNFKRSTSDFTNVHTWKTNQIMDFFFNLAPVLLKSILNVNVYDHMIQLLYIVSKLWNGLLLNEIDEVRIMIDNHINEIEGLYGSTDLTSNVHQLWHSLETVENIGPLKDQNAFVFESINGEVQKMIKSSNGVMSQVSQRYELGILKNCEPVSHAVEPVGVAFKKTDHHIYYGSFQVGRLGVIKGSKMFKDQKQKNFYVRCVGDRYYQIDYFTERLDNRLFEFIGSKIRCNRKLAVNLSKSKHLEHVFEAEITSQACRQEVANIVEIVLFSPEFIPQRSLCKSIQIGSIVRQIHLYHN